MGEDVDLDRCERGLDRFNADVVVWPYSDAGEPASISQCRGRVIHVSQLVFFPEPMHEHSGDNALVNGCLWWPLVSGLMLSHGARLRLHLEELGEPAT